MKRDLDNNKTSKAAGVIVREVDDNPHANDVQTSSQVIVSVTIEGVSKMLFHRYDCEAVETKGKAGKGTKEKKTDNIESYVYRNDDGQLCVPAENLHSTLAVSAKSFQDPRSPRKSARDLVNAGILVLPDLMILKRPDGRPYDTWDFLDRRRVTVQQSAVSRTRPGVEAGWRIEADITILVPGLIPVPLLRTVLNNAGAVVGLCDFRPRFGRFQVTRAEIRDLD
jgi:hypothetical protein